MPRAHLNQSEAMPEPPMKNNTPRNAPPTQAYSVKKNVSVALNPIKARMPVTSPAPAKVPITCQSKPRASASSNLLGKLFAQEGGQMSPEFYTMLFTMHGSLMVFFAITPILFGAFGNFAIPLQIGAEDMAFPTLNMMSYWIFFLSTVVLLVSFVVPGGAFAGGWTAHRDLPAPEGRSFQSLWAAGRR